jgi:hypothetical protein
MPGPCFSTQLVGQLRAILNEDQEGHAVPASSAEPAIVVGAGEIPLRYFPRGTDRPAVRRSGKLLQCATMICQRRMAGKLRIVSEVIGFVRVERRSREQSNTNVPIPKFVYCAAASFLRTSKSIGHWQNP